MSQLITVFGATGKQGGAVVESLLYSGEYKVRGITRNPDGEKAKTMQAKGVEIIQASLDDQASIDRAIAGSYGVFLVTNYWEYMDKEREMKQGKTVADACKKAGVKHVVFSGLEKVKDITGLDCPHFDGKGEIEKYLDKIGQPNTSVRYPYYFENFTVLELGFQKQPDGSYTYTTCMQGEMDAISVYDGGPIVASIFAQPGKFIGKKIGLSGDRMTFKEYIDIISKVTGQAITVNTITVDSYAKLFPGADDLAAMFHYYDNGNPDRDIKLSKQLNPKTKNFTEWAKDNKNNFNF